MNSHVGNECALVCSMVCGCTEVPCGLPTPPPVSPSRIMMEGKIAINEDELRCGRDGCPEGMECVVEPPMPFGNTLYRDEYTPKPLSKATKAGKKKDTAIFEPGPFDGQTIYRSEYINRGFSPQKAVQKKQGELVLGPWGMNGPTYKCVPIKNEQEDSVKCFVCNCTCVCACMEQ
ncbi:hypothetical protein Ciccas_010521 [Cichlidogyrus casuarinus]|uniref:Uncharacterized protein n=1 Tax=Cichlidogyrus casuarinus TaxID=1844966 RepID=A0ABD2PTV5_9PLAT